jgi:hypothetical protein
MDLMYPVYDNIPLSEACVPVRKVQCMVNSVIIYVLPFPIVYTAQTLAYRVSGATFHLRRWNRQPLGGVVWVDFGPTSPGMLWVLIPIPVLHLQHGPRQEFPYLTALYIFN